MNQKSRLLLLSASATALAAICAAGAQAAPQPSSGQAVQIGEVVVTATRRAERLQEVPLAVTALNADTLRAQGITDVGGLTAGRIPGLAVTSLFGSQSSVSLNFRGLGTSDPSQGTQDAPAAFYVDGINYPRTQGLAMELVTPERIEVLRGPQGQLFGRNAEGGAVQIISRRPSGRFGGEVTAGVADFGTHYGRARLDLPEMAGFAVQISGFGREHRGYIENLPNPLVHNITPIQDPHSKIRQETRSYDDSFGYLHSYGGRIAVVRDFGPVNAYYAYDDSRSRESQGYTNFLNAPGAGTLANPLGVNTPALLFTTNGVFSQQPLGSEYPKNSDYSVFNPYFYTRSNGHALILTWQATPDLTVKSITGYRHVERTGESTLTVAVSAVNPDAGEYLNSKTVSQEFQGIYSTKGFNLTGGLIFFHEDVLDQRDAWFTVNCGILGPIVTACTPAGQASRPPYYSPFTPGLTGFKSQTSETRAYAAYGQGTYTPHIMDNKLELTVGLRYSDDTKKGERTIALGQVLPVPIRNEAKTNRLDPAFTVKYSFTSDVNAYFRYATGFRDGGANVRSNTFNAYVNEVLKTYEVGLKSQFFDRRAQLNLAGFHNILTHQQINIQPNPALDPGTTDTINNTHPVTINGVEAEFTARPFEPLTISANLTYLDAPELDFVGLNTVGLAAFTPGYTFSPVTGLVPTAATLAAHPNSAMYALSQVGAPKWAGSLSLDYLLPLQDDTKLAFHMDWSRSSQFYASPVRYVTSVTNGVATPRPTYNAGVTNDRVNVRFAWRDVKIGPSTAEFSLYVNNALNHIDRAFAFAAGNALNVTQQAAQSAIYLQPPRVFGAEARLEF